MIRAILFACVLVVTHSANAEITAEQARVQPRETVEQALPTSHPSALYAYAARLFEEGDKQDAVTWFYVGQLRYRYYLAARPNLPPDGEPALMASMNAVIGQFINEWAGGDPAAWAGSISEAIEWDAANINTVTPKDQLAAEQQKVRGGLIELRDWILANSEKIREQREAAGLTMRQP